MNEITVVPLGAGQDVGRSCILVTMGGKNIMLDCGMHMGFNDKRRFPDFSYITRKPPLTNIIDCVIISHFHLDHCGALPFMSEMFGYDGSIYMTHPTKAICPILLEDYRKIQVERKGDTDFFTSAMIKECMKKVIAVNLHEEVNVDSELKIKAYYAGHVLGAAIFKISVGSMTIVYTGDYNMTPDRHLGSACIDKCKPDLLITESTYATTIRDSKRCRERDFLTKVHEAVSNGGKVLIPVFALGRAQELCILLETYWDRFNLKVPIYFALGMITKANNYYKLFITWTSEKIRKTFVKRNMFDFKHIKPFDRTYIDKPGPMVVFATPGMLHSGLSLQIFRKWAPFSQNMVIMPGYCVAGTYGHKILNGVRRLEFEKGKFLDVKMSIQNLSFSAHADAKGIMQFIRQCEPSNVILVHGESKNMDFLRSKIEQEFKINCFKPANGETIKLSIPPKIPVDVSVNLLKRSMDNSLILQKQSRPKQIKFIHGELLMREKSLRLVDISEIMNDLSMPEHTLTFSEEVYLSEQQLQRSKSDKSGTCMLFRNAMRLVNSRYPNRKVECKYENENQTLEIDGECVLAKIPGETSTSVTVRWMFNHEDIGLGLIKILKGA